MNRFKNFVKKVLSIFNPSVNQVPNNVAHMPKPAQGFSYGQLAESADTIPNYNPNEGAFIPADTKTAFGVEPAYDKETALAIAQEAMKYGMTPSEMFASLFQESSFGKDPNSLRENYATALGPLQITRNYTIRNSDGKPLAYPAFEELFIEPDDRLDLMKSVNFRAKHFKRFYDIYKDRDKAINAYYGDDTYAPKIREKEKSEEVKALLKLIGQYE